MEENTILRRKKRWSLVRIFASLVPEVLWKYLLPHPIRIHFNQNVNFLMPRVKCDICQTGSPKNFNSFKSYLNNSHKTSEINLNSTPKLELTYNDSRISDIQKDLEQLKDQVAKIIRQQQEKQSANVRMTAISSPDCLSESLAQSAPGLPPPPPPPPPLPSHLIATKRSDSIVVRKPKETKPMGPRPHPPVAGFPCGEELLRDLKKVQLKKVQKSPGGGPLKKVKQCSQDPGNFLEEILKKRFSYIQNISSDTSPDSTVVEINDSFNNDLYHRNIYEFPNKAPTAAS